MTFFLLHCKNSQQASYDLYWGRGSGAASCRFSHQEGSCQLGQLIGSKGKMSSVLGVDPCAPTLYRSQQPSPGPEMDSTCRPPPQACQGGGRVEGCRWWEVAGEGSFMPPLSLPRLIMYTLQPPRHTQSAPPRGTESEAHPSPDGMQFISIDRSWDAVPGPPPSHTLAHGVLLPQSVPCPLWAPFQIPDPL